ncbi:hypothetical protein BLNAU_10638 [Blattamonas nauphoetae]|uniref:Uncharacterized protein n=1 Tax=Blattamonas nauphoetae TaxID=2049346 RepID=A0ABQ9XRU5_9EUKA|nr:hypothetical protein BLNAU_10638 [Blattamonas nauphoetae]
MVSFILFALCQISHSVNLQGVIDEFSGNSNTFVLSDEVYDGVNIELKSMPMHFVGHTQSVLVQPQTASHSLFAVFDCSHTLENASLSMNKAESFVTVSSDSSFDFLKCVWMDKVVASPIAVVAGGTVGFTNFDMESTTVEVPLVASSGDGSTVQVTSSSFKNVQVTSSKPMLCNTQTRTVSISSSSFRDISYFPVLSNEEESESEEPIEEDPIEEDPTVQVNEIASVSISSSSFKNCEAALDFTIVPALTAQSLTISSSSFDDTSCGVIAFKKGSKLEIKSTSFHSVSSFGNSSSCLSIETMPQTLDITYSSFSECSSSGKAGAIVFGLPTDAAHPSSAESNAIPSKSLYDNYFKENSGSEASDIFVDETALAYFDAASFEEMSSYSQSPHVLDASGTSYQMPFSVKRFIKRHAWTVVGIVIGFVWLIVGPLMCCCGCCCCGCCTCCCGAWCCRKSKKCCVAGRVCCEDDSVPQSEAQPAQPAQPAPFVQNAAQPAQYVYALPPNHPTQAPLVYQPYGTMPVPVGMPAAVPVTAPQFTNYPTVPSKYS